MNILFATAEAHPFIKAGGLGDVAYALPKTLRKLGMDVRVILPKYSNISSDFKNKMQSVCRFTVPVGWRNQYCGIDFLEYDGIPFYFVDNEYYFKRQGIYGFYDDGERFSYFCKAILESIPYLKDFKPDVLHLNDWHTGMIPALLKAHYNENELYRNIKTVFTIHNLKYQGVFSPEMLGDILSLDSSFYTEDKLKYYNGISFMKAGINFSDRITTVSEAYAEEIKNPFFGEGLDSLLREKDYKLTGILNGLDYELFNPKEDNDIFYKYSSNDIENKVENKIALQKQLNFTVDKNIPMIGIVSRLVKQKGFDLIAHVIEEMLGLGVQLVVLGTGEEGYQDLFEYYATIYPKRLSSSITFNNALAKKIYAASDMFLMPSLFEPCGIGQLISLKYGSVPIVRETGGLKDTVIPYNEYTGEGTGFSFENYNAHELLEIIKYALNIFKDKDRWSKIVENGMKQDFSWNNSAEKFIELYNSIK
jgi:starch synthase